MLVWEECWTVHAAYDTWEAHQRENQRPCLLLLLSSLAITAEEGPGRFNIMASKFWFWIILLLEKRTSIDRQTSTTRRINISFYIKAFSPNSFILCSWTDFYFFKIYSCFNSSMFVAKPIVSVNDVITMIITNKSILSEMLLAFLFCF